MRTIFKVFIEFVTVLLLLYVLGFWPWGMWDLTPLPGIKPASAALEGRAHAAGGPGNPSSLSEVVPFLVIYLLRVGFTKTL